MKKIVIRAVFALVFCSAVWGLCTVTDHYVVRPYLDARAAEMFEALVVKLPRQLVQDFLRLDRILPNVDKSRAL